MLQTAADKWVEIDIDAVKNNLKEVQSIIDEDVRLIAVVKADAYGHGAVETARILYQNGVDFFAVTFLEEALELRKAGIRAGILIFSPLVSEQELKEAVNNHLTVTVASAYDWKLVEQLAERLNSRINVHIKVETGLGRFGMDEEELMELSQYFRLNSNIFLEGIYTHMADASAANAAYTQKQFDKFMHINKKIEEQGIHIPLKHCANSSVLLKFPHMQLDGVRIGTLLSGQHPAGNFSRRLQVFDPYKFKSRIISVKTVDKGSYLGYYRTYRLKNKAQIAVIPVGFNDGLAMAVANRPAGFVDLLKSIVKLILQYFNIPRFTLQIKYKEKNYPVRGKVFMQLALLEIPLGVDVKIGDEVEVPVRKTLASRNISRVYLSDGKAGKVSSQEGLCYIVEES